MAVWFPLREGQVCEVGLWCFNTPVIEDSVLKKRQDKRQRFCGQKHILKACCKVFETNSSKTPQVLGKPVVVLKDTLKQEKLRFFQIIQTRNILFYSFFLDSIL